MSDLLDKVSEKVVERAKRANAAKRASGRRRKVDPTTTDRVYTADEWEFMSAVDEYKRRRCRPFPACSEILEVLAGLGYRKAAHLTQ